MKRIALLCCLLACTCVGRAESGKNLQDVKNASFETLGNAGRPAEWSGNADVFQQDTSAARTGSASLRWTCGDAERYDLSNQPLTLKAGDCVEFSVWVRTKDLKGGNAMICIEWGNAATGKWMGGSYAKGPTGNTPEWTKITGYAQIPMEAAGPHMECYASRGATGTVWFDDVEIKSYTPPCLAAMTSDHYRHQTTGGTVRFRLGLDSRKYTMEDFLKCSELKVSGEKLAAPISLKPAIWNVNTLEFQLDSDPLPVGEYTVTAEVRHPADGSLETASLTLTRLNAFPERKAYFDAHRRLILDGKPFFPLGLYFHMPTDEDMDRLEASPFNCIMPYPRIPRERVDALYEHDIRTIYSVKDLYETLNCKTDEEGRAKTTEIINNLKDHPGIMAWYVNDELPLTMLEQLCGHRALCETLDPSRPTWAVLYQVEVIRRYTPTCDVIGTDPYPIPGRAANAWDWSVKTNDGVFRFHPTWQVPQYFNWANYKKTEAERKTKRTPTFAEMRGMTWMAIAGGANGIIGYSYFDLFRNEDPKTTPEARQAAFDKCWADVCRVGEEVRERFPILLSVEPPQELAPAAESSAEIAYRLYGYDGFTWLLLVNTNAEAAQTAVFDLPSGMQILNASELSEAVAKISNGKLTVEIQPLVPAFVQLK